jgi:DNA primase
MAHQAGFENVVASLGTALTPAQVAVIARYAREIVLAYDVDPAGQHAGSIGGAELFRLIGALAAEETGVEITRVRVARLPEGKDPDEVIRETPDLWREAIRTAQPIIEFLIDYYATSFDVRKPDGKRKAVAALMPLLRDIRDPVVRDGYLQALARRTGVEERVLLEALHAPQSGVTAAARGGRNDAPTAASGRFTADAIISAPDSIDTKAELRAVSLDERKLLRLLLLVPEQQERVADTLRAQNMQLPSTPARELLAAMLADREHDREAGGAGSFERMRFLDALEPELHGLAVALFAERGPDPNDLTADRVRIGVDQCLLALEADRLEEEVSFNSMEQKEAEAAGDTQEVLRLAAVQRDLNEARRSLDRRRHDTSLLSAAGGHR